MGTNSRLTYKISTFLQNRQGGLHGQVNTGTRWPIKRPGGQATRLMSWYW